MEVWKDIKGYEGIYQISNLGRVRMLVFRNNRYAINKIRMKKIYQPKNKKDYQKVGLTDKLGRTKKHLIHRLVASAFVPNPLNELFVNHKDENKQNNRYDNLEWCSREYNNQYSFKLHPERIKSMQTKEVEEKRIKKLSKRVNQYNLDKSILIATYSSSKEAGRITGLSQGNISNCCRGLYKQAYGYIWEYAN